MVGTSRTQGITYSEHAAIGDFWLLLAVVSFFFFFLISLKLIFLTNLKLI